MREPTHPLVLVAAKHRLDVLLSDELPAVAARFVALGIVSPALEELASLRSSYTEEAQALFREALRELEIELPSERNILLMVAREIAAEMLAGRITARAGAEKIWDVRSRAESVSAPELEPFSYADCEECDHDHDSVEFAEGVLAAARELVGGGSGSPAPAP